MKQADAVLIPLLAAGGTIAAAAERSGLSARTIQRRLVDAAFRRQIQEARGAMVERALGQLSEGHTEAVAALRKLLKAKSESVRLGAARSILEVGCNLRKSVDLEERLRVLEQQRLGGKQC